MSHRNATRRACLPWMAAISVATCCATGCASTPSARPAPSLEPLKSPRTSSRAASPWTSALRDLAGSLIKNLRDPRDKALKVAVLDFTQAGGQPCSLGVVVAEELTTALFAHAQVVVIERRLLHRVLDENQQTQSDFFDPAEVARLGQLVGAEAIVTGTLLAAPGQYTINARMIRVQEGRVISVGQRAIPKTLAYGRGGCLPRATPPPRT